MSRRSERDSGPLADFSRRSDSEHEQVLIRIVIGLTACLYLLTLKLGGSDNFAGPLIVWLAVGFMAASLMLFLGVLLFPAPSPLRRILGIGLDMATTSVVMGLAGEQGAPLLAVYLWVIIGNGFRYGLSYLTLATILAVTGFGTVMALSAYWHEHGFFGASFLLVLLLIPPYMAALLRKLTEAIRRANEASRAKSQFLAKMSHELRTPLNGVIGMSDLLMDSDLSREHRSLARTIQSSARTLLGIIENVLDFSKIEAGRITLECVELDLHRLLADIIKMFRAQAQRKGLALHLRIDPQVPFLLRGDPLHLRQIVTNLVSNAVKFTEVGWVELRVRLARSATAESPARLRLEVEDTGIGIAPADQEHIFESFRQADSSTTRRFGGTGLGTAIARELTVLMGGEIGLTSEPGKGALFWVELPISAQDDHQACDGNGPGFRELRALIVGTSQVVSELEACLRAWGMARFVAESSARAFAELIRAEDTDHPYGVVLVCADGLDLEVEQFAAGIRAESLLCETGLVLVQAPLLHDSETRWREAGYLAVLYAPLDKTLLYNAIHAARSAQDMPENVVSLADHYRKLTASTQSGLRILVAEDNETNRRVLQGLLERIGHVVTLAQDGEAALDLLADSGKHFDLLILDHNMPGRSGLEVLQAHRFLSPTDPLPTIILTADATPEAQAIYRAAGVDAYLTKPVETLRLLEVIATVTRQPSAGGTGQPRAVADRPVGTGRADEIVEEQKLRALRRISREPGFFQDLVGGFIGDSERSIAKMSQALAEEDYLALRGAIHALKGSAAELGAVRLLDLCAELRALKPFELRGHKAGRLLTKLQAAHEETARRLRELAQRGQDAS